MKSLDNPNLALRYLERVLRKEFALRREETGSDGEPQEIKLTIRDFTAPIANENEDAKQNEAIL